MKNEDILDIVRRCKLSDGEKLVQGEAYLFNCKFQRKVSGRLHYEVEEIIDNINIMSYNEHSSF